MNKEQIAKLLENMVGAQNLKINEEMKNHTTFKVGGSADILVLPDNAEKLCNIVRLCIREQIPYFNMGNGSNLIVRDKGIRGIVIKLFDNFNKYEVRDNIIEAEAGILLSRISNVALEHGLSGLEFASGIPGTLGGAVAMNAGAYGPEMKDVVIKTEYMDQSGNIHVVNGTEHEFGYRTSFIQKSGGIVLKSQMKLTKSDTKEIKKLMGELNKRRKESQPLELPSAGSIFKRPEGFYTGRLIEDCGLKGFSIGGAQVSNKHCGFIVNTGNATANDIISLIKYVQTTVKSKFGVELQTEVKIVGEE